MEEIVDWPAAEDIMLLSFGAGNGLSVDGGLGPSHDDVIEAEFELDEKHDTRKSFSLVIWLLERKRDLLFRTTDELSALVEDLPRILTLDDWCHPDVYGGPKPSDSKDFRQFAEVLATGDVEKYSPTETPNNRDWQKWYESKYQS